MSEKANEVSEDTAALVGEMRRKGQDLARVEAKSAVGGTPKSLRDTLSAFSNTHGGVILLGLDEADGFLPAAGFDAHAIRDGLAGMCANDLTPPVRCDIDIEEFEGSLLLRADVPEMDVFEKPCFVTQRGTYGGSYVRVGDGDHKLNEYEVTALKANRQQPLDDREPVPGSGLHDLDSDAVTRFLSRLRRTQSRVFSNIDDVTNLVRLNVLAELNGEVVCTLGGLLCLGNFPQQFFPQLNVTFVVVPGITMGETTGEGTRFLDNQTIDGTIPAMIEAVEAAITRNMSRQAQVRGLGRTDRYDYPTEVIREAMTNALMHRDYGALARGTQVQVELYLDRLDFINPGGLFGPLDAAQFGADHLSSSRNSTVARLLADIVLPERNELVCENRGSGIPRMLTLLKEAGMSPPDFEPTLTRFRASIPRHALLDEETVTWIGELDAEGLSDAQVMALAMMRGGREVSNEKLRGWGFDRLTATQALTRLVTEGLASKDGGRRYATYILAGRAAENDHAHTAALTRVETPLHGSHDGVSPSPSRRGTTSAGRLQRDVLSLMATGELVTTGDVMTTLDVSYAKALRAMNALIEQGAVEATAPARSRHRRYRKVD